MTYKTKKEKINEIIEKAIRIIKLGKDVDYHQLVSEIQSNTGVAEKIVEEQLKIAIQSKKIKEVRILTILDEDIPKFLKDLKEKEKEIEKEVEEAGLNGK